MYLLGIRFLLHYTSPVDPFRSVCLCQKRVWHRKTIPMEVIQQAVPWLLSVHRQIGTVDVLQCATHPSSPECMQYNEPPRKPGSCVVLRVSSEFCEASECNLLDGITERGSVHVCSGG